jgi:hypothetical protein
MIVKNSLLLLKSLSKWLRIIIKNLKQKVNPSFDKTSINNSYKYYFDWLTLEQII